jgi:hypothetical protein
VSSDRRPASGQTTCPLTGTILRSAAFTSATAHRHPSSGKLGRLPTRCPPNPSCCRPSTPAFGCAQTALFRAPLRHRLQRSPSASCRPACISNKRGQLCSVTWSCSYIPLVLRDCFDTPLVLRGSVSACVHSNIRMHTIVMGNKLNGKESKLEIFCHM